MRFEIMRKYVIVTIIPIVTFENKMIWPIIPWKSGKKWKNPNFKLNRQNTLF